MEKQYLEKEKKQNLLKVSEDRLAYKVKYINKNIT